MIEKHRCLNCDKEVVVARVVPCSEDEEKELTGIWVERIDDEGRELCVGVLCKDCAFGLCDEGKIGLGFAGGRAGNLSLWDAVIDSPNFVVKYPKNLIRVEEDYI